MPSADALYPYNTVLWTTGATGTFSTTQAFGLGWFVSRGGKVLVTGQEVAPDFASTDSFPSTMHASLIDPAVSSRTIIGQDLLGGLLLPLNGGTSANNQQTPDALQVLGDAVPLAWYIDGSGAGRAAGLRYSEVDGRLVYLGFGLEGIQTTAQRAEVLERLLRWLESGAASSPAFPTTDVLDDFDRPNGGVGSAWTGATTSYGIVSHALYNAGGNASVLLWGSPFGPDQEVYATLSAVDAGADEIDLILKAQGTGECNLLEAWYQPSRGTVRVSTCHNYGQWVQHGADIPVTFEAGDRFGARARADGTVEIYRNDTLIGSVRVAESWPYRANGGRIGVWLMDAPAAILDDVGGGALP
jgi:hypothetical protein